MGVPHRDEIVGETLDYNGRRVVLLARIWQEKVVVVHPEMLLYEDAVLQVVASAEHVEPDPRHGQRTHYCVRGLGPTNWLVVVVSYEQTPARIITAFGRRKDPMRWNRST